MIEKPTASEEVFVINEDLNAHYSVFRNGAVFRRGANAWPFWEKMPYAAPTANGFLIQSVADGANYDCCEHACVVIHGTANWVVTTPSGDKEYLWERGSTNVDNGIGYLPADVFSRTFHGDHTTCCIVQPFMGRQTTTRYSFEVLTAPKVLTRDALAVHYCDTKQTDMGVAADTPVEGGIAIVVYQES